MSFLGTQIEEMSECDLFNTQLPSGKRVFDWEWGVGENQKGLLVAGPNGSGKSLLSFFMETRARKEKYGVRVVSMTNRTTSSIQRVMIFGSESDESTGNNSINAVSLCIESSNKQETPWVAILDEPDIGLSEGYQRAMGQYVGQFLNDNKENPNCMGIILISHSRTLVKALQEVAGTQFTLYMGKDKQYYDWLFGEEEYRSVDDLLNLHKDCFSKHSAVVNALKKKRKTT